MIRYGSVIVLIVLCFMLFAKESFSQTQSSRTQIVSYEGDWEAVHSFASNPNVPYSYSFAGKTVDLDRVDMYERFDRELTSLVYGHSNTLLTIKRANKYFPVMEGILKRNGVPLDFLYLAAIESTLDIRAYSPAKAAGLWQFLASTGKQYGLEINDEVDERYDVEKSTIAAVKYLKEGYAKYKDWATVAASYNAGMGRISNALSTQMVDTSFDLYLNSETSRYVFRIIAMKMVMDNPKKYGFQISKKQLYQPIEYKIVEVKGAVENWSEWAKTHGILYSQLREMNPWIRGNKLTNKAGKVYKVKIPTAKGLYRSKNSSTAYNSKWVID